MLSEQALSVKCLPDATVDDLLGNALRVRDLLVGASAYVRGKDPSNPLHELLASARVSAAAVVAQLEEAVAVAAERARAEHQRIHGQAGKSVGQEVR